MYDVIISGAGPSGSKCAEVLAKDGFKVALIEKDTNWRKPCGGAVNQRVFKYFPQLCKVNFNKINGITIYSPNFTRFGYNWKDRVGYSISVDRLEFDNIIRNIAIDAGAELFDKNISYDFIIKNNKKIGIKTKSPSGIQEYKGKIIIIADGMSSNLAIKSGLKKKWSSEELIIAKCGIFKGENKLDKESISLFFQSFKGYGWVFPLNDNKFNIGIGLVGEDNLNYNINQIYSDFFYNPEIKKLFPKSSYKKIWEGTYPIPGRGINEKSLYGDNIMLIGDVAGFVSPLSGEGICSGIVSGKVAAETAFNALESEDISAETLKNYKIHPTIKKITRSFKLALSLVDFFYQNQGQNLSRMFKIAKCDSDFREQVLSMFLLSQAPPKDFISKLKSEN